MSLSPQSSISYILWVSLRALFGKTLCTTPIFQSISICHQSEKGRRLAWTLLLGEVGQGDVGHRPLIELLELLELVQRFSSC